MAEERTGQDPEYGEKTDQEPEYGDGAEDAGAQGVTGDTNPDLHGAAREVEESENDPEPGTPGGG